MRLFYFVFLAAICCCLEKSHPAYAATAVFSQDGNRIYLAGKNLSVLDLAHPDHFDEIASSSLSAGEEMGPVTRANDGTILCLSMHHLVVFNPKDRSFTKIYDAPESDTLEDLAYNPKDSVLLVTLRTESDNDYGDEPFKAICFKAGDPRPIQVTSRMTGRIESPIYDAQGSLYFSWHGDLWQGGIILRTDDDEEVTSRSLIPGQAAGVRGWLLGDRIAPLARLKTADYAAWNMGVSEIAIARSRLYLVMHAMGHVYGYLLSTARPNASGKHPDRSFREGSFEDFTRLLASVKEIPGHGIPTDLCASPDGRRVFYYVWGAGRSQDNGYYLIENDAPPRRLPVPISAE